LKHLFDCFEKLKFSEFDFSMEQIETTVFTKSQKKKYKKLLKLNQPQKPNKKRIPKDVQFEKLLGLTVKQNFPKMQKVQQVSPEK
jgi:hypothetical protein